MDRSSLPHATSYVSRRWRLFFAATPKAGCTSILHSLAQLHGENLGDIQGSTFPEVSRLMTLHDVSRWHHMVEARTLSDEELAAISPDNGWAIFTVVRHPVTRIWSAWQSKLFLREPYFVEHFGREPWFPNWPSTPDQMLEDFSRFVQGLASDGSVLNADRHWAPQVDVLNTAAIDYTFVGHLERLSDTFEMLEWHLSSIGWNGKLSRQRVNETQVPYPGALLSEDIANVLMNVYRADLDTFAYRGVDVHAGRVVDRDSIRERLPLLSELAHRHERVGDLARLSKEKVGGLEDEIESLRHQTTKLIDQLDIQRAANASIDQEVHVLRDALDRVSRENQRLRMLNRHADLRRRDAENQLQRWMNSRTMRLLRPLHGAYAKTRASLMRARHGGA